MTEQELIEKARAIDARYQACAARPEGHQFGEVQLSRIDAGQGSVVCKDCGLRHHVVGKYGLWDGKGWMGTDAKPNRYILEIHARAAATIVYERTRQRVQVREIPPEPLWPGDDIKTLMSAEEALRRIEGRTS